MVRDGAESYFAGQEKILKASEESAADPTQGTAASPAVPNQVNDAASPQSTGAEGNASPAGNSKQPRDDKNVSSSRKKKKKHKHEDGNGHA